MLYVFMLIAFVATLFTVDVVTTTRYTNRRVRDMEAVDQAYMLGLVSQYQVTEVANSDIGTGWLTLRAHRMVVDPLPVHMGLYSYGHLYYDLWYEDGLMAIA